MFSTGHEAKTKADQRKITTTEQKIGCIVVCHREEKFLGINCKKGRGIIMPGGKWEPPETYTMAAAREAREETGLLVNPFELDYVWTGPDGDGWDVMAFWYPFDMLDLRQQETETSSGNPTWREEGAFLGSRFSAYYQILFQVLRQKQLI